MLHKIVKYCYETPVQLPNMLSVRSFSQNIVSVVSQAYAVNLMEEYVLRGNSAILKCHIPSFVSEYVMVTSWIITEGDEEIDIKLDSTNNFNGTK